MWFVLWAYTARADALFLDNGAQLVGQLAAYERGGTCRITIGAGELAGTDLVLPCSRIVKFERDADDTPVSPTPAVSEVAIEPPAP